MHRFRIPNNTTINIVALFTLSVIVRLITAEYVDLGGDNSMRWFFASSLHFGIENLEWSHHTSRWIITLPLWGLLELFGDSLALYYILPIASTSVGVVFIYLIGSKLESPKLGMTAALLTILFPQMVQSGSQLWPSVFQFALLTLSIWSILVWLDKRQLVFLVMAALAFFCIWGARLSAIYLYPGLVLLIYLPSRDVKAVILFSLTIGFLCGLEWLFFWLDTGNPMGRIGVITQTAIARHETLSFSKYLLRFVEFTKLRGLVIVLILTLVAAGTTLRNHDKRWVAISLIYLGYLFMLVYMVASINPIKPATWPSSRYWCAAAPIGLLLVCNTLLQMKASRPKTAKIALLLLFVSFFAFSAKKIQANNAIIQITNNQRIIEPLLTKHTPILFQWEPWRPNLVEGALYSLLGITKTNKGSSARHVKRAMMKERNRIVWLFLKDKTLSEVYRQGELVPVGHYQYIYLPPGANRHEPYGAIIQFDRKTSVAQAVP